MGAHLDLQSVKKEVIYKVGRNVLLFQQMERVLKYLVSHGTIAGTKSEFLSKHEKRKQAVSKQTLGMVVRNFIDGVDPTPEPEELKEAFISFKFEAELSDGVSAEIEQLVAERNTLIHHFFENIEANSLESWQEASVRLDSQEERLTRTTGNLRNIAQALSDGRKELADRMMTEEFKQQIS